MVSDITGCGQDAVGAQRKELTHLSELGESFMAVRFKGWMGVHQAEEGGMRVQNRESHKPKLRRAGCIWGK